MDSIQKNVGVDHDESNRIQNLSLNDPPHDHEKNTSFGTSCSSWVQNYKTMSVKGTVGKDVIHILVDCGSTHNFVDNCVAKKLGCQIISTCPLVVTVRDGYNIASNNSQCCEMMLGIEWLSTLGDVNCIFKDLRMEFVYKKMMVLRGGFDENEGFNKRNCIVGWINVRPYRHPPTQKDAIENMAQELLDTGVIKPSNIPFASPIVMVKKKDNTWRIVLSIEDKLNYLEQPIPHVPVTLAGQQVALEILAAHTAWQAEQELLQTTLGHPVTLGLGVSLILIGLRKEYDGFVQNYNMHSMGKTVNELHAMLKLHEQTLPKSNAPALNAIRAGKV
uniref:Reverse transcriptase domain-containing protein n=1 Tax=Tanacetum cinerariifolium TaxID=118510 RepID=A0A699HU67_TANCI|nr:hypothetical protein [Tanacetum cinerariifolium]